QLTVCLRGGKRMNGPVDPVEHPQTGVRDYLRVSSRFFFAGALIAVCLLSVGGAEAAETAQPELQVSQRSGPGGALPETRGRPSPELPPVQPSPPPPSSLTVPVPPPSGAAPALRQGPLFI